MKPKDGEIRWRILFLKKTNNVHDLHDDPTFNQLLLHLTEIYSVVSIILSYCIKVVIKLTLTLNFNLIVINLFILV